MGNGNWKNQGIELVKTHFYQAEVKKAMESKNRKYRQIWIWHKPSIASPRVLTTADNILRLIILLVIIILENHAKQ